MSFVPPGLGFESVVTTACPWQTLLKELLLQSETYPHWPMSNVSIILTILQANAVFFTPCILGINLNLCEKLLLLFIPDDKLMTFGM